MHKEGHSLEAEQILEPAILESLFNQKELQIEPLQLLRTIYLENGHPATYEELIVSIPASHTQRDSFVREAAYFFSEQAQSEKAFRILEDGIRVDPSDQSLRYTLSEMYEQKGDFKKAAQEYRHALELDDDPEGCFKLGRIFASMGDEDSARVMFDRAIEFDRDYREQIASFDGFSDYSDAALSTEGSR